MLLQLVYSEDMLPECDIKVHGWLLDLKSVSTWAWKDEDLRESQDCKIWSSSGILIVHVTSAIHL